MKAMCLLAAYWWVAVPLWAEEVTTDTIRSIQMDEVVIVATPKETRALRELPMASTRLSQQMMRAQQVTGIKRLTSVIPNLFIPDYGSRLTTAVYIRGIGSRINTPAVGLYVDNIPYIDKSAFDFNYADIEQIEVLRGPQSLLYGRNTMGGLIKVQTKSPFDYQGTDLRLGAATYGDYNASLTHYHRISRRFAFSAGGFYEHAGGFFKNVYKNNERIDRGDNGGGRLHAVVLPTDNLKLDLNLNYEYSDQGGYPYYYMGAVSASSSDEESELKDYVGHIAYNDPSGYRRSLLNGGMNIEYHATDFILSFITGYQHLNDRMAMDQDFTPRDIFTLVQKQRSNTVSEEIVLKSNPGKRWQWTTGVFGFYQWLDTSAPVLFKQQGIQELIEDNANAAFPSSPQAPQMALSIHNDQLLIGGDFSTPQMSGAVYHQSTWNDLFVKGLSVSAGLRLDYEKMWLDYSSASDPMLFGFSFAMGGMRLEDQQMQAVSSLAGKMKHDYLQLLPKFSVQYEWSPANNVYATVAKGYRSGGYNIQMFSDLVQSQFINVMKGAMEQSESLKPIAGMISSMMPTVELDVKETALYRPEYTWSYEIGTHLTGWQKRLTADLAAFWMNTRDQQVSQFSDNGMGRVTRNAGRSRSVGAEACVTACLTDAFTLNVSYGYTHATFRNYVTVDDEGREVNYRGYKVPFIPRHTLNVGGQYVFALQPHKLFDYIRLHADYSAAGSVYWTESNNAVQPFYGTLNARLSLEKGQGSVAFWIRNALNKDYTSFYFESMGNRFMQRGRPLQAGIELRCRF